MDSIAVLIPCYNEAQSIGKVVRDARHALPEAVVYVYDNNSTDGTDQIARDAGAVVRYERKQGKGNVIRRMFREVDADCYLMLDGDDTYPLENAADMVALVLTQQVDMVVGDRLSSTYFTENKRRFHGAGNLLVRKGINLLFRSEISDIMTGYRAFSPLFVKSFPVLSKGFEIETEMSIHAVDKNMRIQSVVVDYRDRTAGSVSKLNTVSDGIRVLKTIAVLFKNYRPLAFYACLAALLMVVAALLMIGVLSDYLRTGLVPRFPSLIVSGFLGLASLQSLFTGLILDNLRQKDRHDFEMRLHAIQAQRPVRSTHANAE